jgi:hypothetical protein
MLTAMIAGMWNWMAVEKSLSTLRRMVDVSWLKFWKSLEARPKRGRTVRLQRLPS